MEIAEQMGMTSVVAVRADGHSYDSRATPCPEPAVSVLRQPPEQAGDPGRVHLLSKRELF